MDNPLMVEVLKRIMVEHETGQTLAYLVSKYGLPREDVEAGLSALESEGWIKRKGKLWVQVRPARKWIIRRWL